MRFHTLDVTAFNRIGRPYRLPLHNQGLVLVEGENRDGGSVIPGNGAGKSLSIVETLTWAVHGRMVRYDDQQVTVEAVHPAHGADVAVEVELRGLRHRLHRQRPPKGSATYTISTQDPTTEQWVPLRQSKDPARTATEALLGLDYTAFRYAIVVQGSDALAADGFATQMQVLETLLRLDELGDWSDEANKRTTKRERDVAALQAEVSTTQAALEQAQATLTQLDEQERTAAEAMQREEREIHAALMVATQAAEQLDALETEVEQITAKITTLRTLAVTANANLTPYLQEQTRIQQQQGKLVCDACGRPFKSAEETKKAQQKAEARLAVLAQAIKTEQDTKAAADRERAQLDLTRFTQDQALQRTRVQAARVPDLQARLLGLTQRTQDFAAQRKALAQQVATIEESLVERQALLRDARQLITRSAFWVGGFGRDGLQADLFSLGVPELQRAAQRYSEALAGQHLRVFFNPQRGSKRENLITIDGATAPTYKGCSRGEKERINLIVAFSLRALARWRLGEPINLSVFDEVFDHVDPGGLAAIAQLLQAEVAATGGTIFVVTHNPTLKALFPGAKIMRVVREHDEATICYG